MAVSLEEVSNKKLIFLMVELGGGWQWGKVNEQGVLGGAHVESLWAPSYPPKEELSFLQAAALNNFPDTQYLSFSPGFPL